MRIPLFLALPRSCPDINTTDRLIAAWAFHILPGGSLAITNS